MTPKLFLLLAVGVLAVTISILEILLFLKRCRGPVAGYKYYWDENQKKLVVKKLYAKDIYVDY